MNKKKSLHSSKHIRMTQYIWYNKNNRMLHFVKRITQHYYKEAFIKSSIMKQISFQQYDKAIKLMKIQSIK